MAAALVAVSAATAQEVKPTSPEGPPQQAASESRALGAPSSVNGRKPRPAAGSEVPSRNWFGGTILPLAGVLGLVVVGGGVLRSAARRQGGIRSALGAGGRAPSGILEIIGRYPVGRGVSLVLLKLDTRVLLLSQSTGGRFGAGATFATLAEISDPEQVASILIRSRDAEGDSLAERFRSMLGRFDRQMDKPTSGETIWDGSRSDIPVIDLTQREQPKRRALKARIAQTRKAPTSGALA